MTKPPYDLEIKADLLAAKKHLEIAAHHRFLASEALNRALKLQGLPEVRNEKEQSDDSG